MLNIAVVGAGYWGPNLIRNVAGLADARLEVVCDREPKRLDAIERRFPGVAVVSDFAEVLRNAKVDAVILATPAETHAELGMQVLESGRHLLVEKPMAMTSREAQALVETADARRRILMVGHTFEYNAAVCKVRQLIRDGEIGKMCYLYSQRVNLGQVRTDCNAMWNLAPHDVSIANFLTGDAPIWVRATGYKFLDHGGEDVVFMNLGYPDNRVAHIHVSWLDPNKIRRTTIVGEEKMIVYDDMSNEAKVKVYDKGIRKVPSSENLEAPPFGEFQFLTRSGDIWIPKIDFREPLQAEVSHFVACALGNEEPRTGGRNGLAVVKALEAAQTSLANDGKTIEL